MTRSLQRTSRSHQRGLSLFGLMFWAIVMGFVGYLAVTVLPTINEYLTIQRSVEKIAAEQPGTVGEVRTAFNRQKDIEYSITAISGDDLVVTKENDRVVISYSYQRELPIMGPVYLLLKYQGRSR